MNGKCSPRINGQSPIGNMGNEYGNNFTLSLNFDKSQMKSPKHNEYSQWNKVKNKIFIFNFFVNLAAE